MNGRSFYFVLQVFYFDYGTVDEVLAKDTRLMRKQFVQLLPQAFRGCLDNIRPTDGLWTREATLNFKSAIGDNIIYAKVIGVDLEVRTQIM